MNFIKTSVHNSVNTFDHLLRAQPCLGAVRDSEMHKSWHFPPGTHWNGGSWEEAVRKLQIHIKSQGKDMLMSTVTKFQEWSRESALQKIEKKPVTIDTRSEQWALGRTWTGRDEGEMEEGISKQENRSYQGRKQKGVWREHRFGMYCGY